MAIARGPVLLAAALVAAAFAASASPESGTLLTATRVGPLRLGTATVAQLTAFAGRPQKTWRFAANGQIAGNGLFLSRAQAFGYGCTATACRTVYAFRAGRLIGVSTRDPGFHTQAGTHVGMTLTQALVREPGARWAGFGVQCPAIVFRATGTTVFKAGVTLTPPRVSDFLLSRSPQSFSDGC